MSSKEQAELSEVRVKPKINHGVQHQHEMTMMKNRLHDKVGKENKGALGINAYLPPIIKCNSFQSRVITASRRCPNDNSHMHRILKISQVITSVNLSHHPVLPHLNCLVRLRLSDHSLLLELPEESPCGLQMPLYFGLELKLSSEILKGLCAEEGHAAVKFIKGFISDAGDTVLQLS